jgi:hypothetical protein
MPGGTELAQLDAMRSGSADPPAPRVITLHFALADYYLAAAPDTPANACLGTTPCRVGGSRMEGSVPGLGFAWRRLPALPAGRRVRPRRVAPRATIRPARTTRPAPACTRSSSERILQSELSSLRVDDADVLRFCTPTNRTSLSLPFRDWAQATPSQPFSVFLATYRRPATRWHT